MSSKLLLLLSFFFAIHEVGNAQYSKLLRLTEDEVRKQVKEFPIVERDSSEHEMIPYLLFKNRKKEVKLVCYFYYDRKCHLVIHTSSQSTFRGAVGFANKSYQRVSNDKWLSRDSTYTILINKFDDKVVTNYVRRIGR